MKWVFGTFKGIAQHIIATWFEGFGGGGQVVSVLAFYSDNPSSNPAEVNNFNLYNCAEMNKKEAGDGPILKTNMKISEENLPIFWPLWPTFLMLLNIYFPFDRLYSCHCWSQNSNQNPLKELNIALLKQFLG